MQLTHIVNHFDILLVHRRLCFYTNGKDDRDLFSFSIKLLCQLPHSSKAEDHNGNDRRCTGFSRVLCLNSWLSPIY